MSNEVSIEIELDMWKKNHLMLFDAKENADELLESHLISHGILSKKNASIAEMYEKEIRAINEMLDYSENNSGSD